MTASSDRPITPVRAYSPGDLRASLFLLAVVVLLALGGLAVDGNWPKFVRVAASFGAYMGVLAAVLRLRSGTHGTPPYWNFALAGAAAGLTSGLVRSEVRADVMVVGSIAAALLIGGMHWLALRSWRWIRVTLKTQSL
jgi:hypothetical protein